MTSQQQPARRRRDKAGYAFTPRASLLLLAAAVLAIVLSGERTALLQESAWWPRQLAVKFGSSSAPTAADPAQEIHCLALNLYFEARGEPTIGKAAVGHVVMNRIADAAYPDTVCAVIRQGGAETRNRCQFSWWCDGLSDRPRNWRAWAESREIARQVYWAEIADPTRGALWYHATSVAPAWRKGLRQGPSFGEHIFYLRRQATPGLQRAAVKP